MFFFCVGDEVLAFLNTVVFSLGGKHCATLGF